MGRFENSLPRQHFTGPGAGKGWKAMMGISVHFSNGCRVHMWCWDGDDFSCLHKKIENSSEKNFHYEIKENSCIKVQRGKTTEQG